MNTGAAKKSASINSFIEIVGLKGEIKDIKIQELFKRLSDDEAKLLALKQCLKAWNIPFDGADHIPAIVSQYHPEMHPECFGKYFNQDLYPKAYALSLLAYQFEKNGIPAEHAAKLCVIFDDEKRLLKYLKDYQDGFQKSTAPLHDACLFTLPDFQEQGFLDEKTGCKFELFKNMAEQSSNMLKREFKELLPFAWELQKRVVAAKKPGANPDKIAITQKMAAIQENEKRLDTLERKKSTLTDVEEIEYLKLPSTISEQLLELSQLCSGKFLKDLSVLELRGFCEAYKFDSEAGYKIFLVNGIPAKFYGEFKKLNRQDAGKNIPDLLIDGNDHRHRGFYLMKVPVQDESHAARAACFGKLTHCCQSLSGEVGQPCAIHGLTSPNGGFYVLCKGDSHDRKVTDTVVAQSWVWRSKTGAFGYDSIESSPAFPNEVSQVLFNQLSQQLIAKGFTTKVFAGQTLGYRLNLVLHLHYFQNTPLIMMIIVIP